MPEQVAIAIIAFLTLLVTVATTAATRLWRALQTSQAENKRQAEERIKATRELAILHSQYADRFGRTAIAATEVSREQALTIESLTGGNE